MERISDHKHFKANIVIQERTVPVEIDYYVHSTDTTTISGDVATLLTLKEWGGSGVLDFDLVHELIGAEVKTSIGTIIITGYWIIDHNFEFVGTGKLNLVEED